MEIEEFEQVTSSLISEVQMLSMHWDLLKKLDREITSNPNKFSSSKHFWGMTFNAHLTSVRLLLTRIYDPHKKVLSIMSWLKIIEAELGTFNFMINPSDNLNPMVGEDIERSDPKENKLIDTLINQLRNNAIAHVSMKKAKCDVNVFEESELNIDEYQNLVMQAQQILNNYIPYILGYKVNYTNCSDDDYQEVLCLL
ncbi:AbiU2 domain-containing protein [Vibrio crassostreae]|uniref:AbiU2 domain-containing protein n=1 Tax=Vibrio crassostreae TaxID=246167 RepID=UPI000F4A4551|nr:hypothetical protein [Vibrio crassostreae]ROO57565.1 hypothetical protein EDB56_101710 [Vibrio crassostreae]ROO64824.1 hypothetical protein EDB58_102719 [Vibrio crassostreae]ROO74616.1 hypothetical protein EDB57_1053 [Vibrio crassostreae]ROO77223.1 hypothetical protein EDB53_1058 [Vibrio crassostreae]ROR70072.1 hypothetical protein EDB59_0719 [Vibrio crassostreae]